MGEWYDYEVRFADKSKNLVDALVERGFAAKEAKVGRSGNSFEDLRLFIGKIDKTLHEIDEKKYGEHFLGSNYTDRDKTPYESITIGLGKLDTTERDESSFYYVSKWVPNESIIAAVSQVFPGEILECVDFPPYRAPEKFYMKGGDYCNKNGEICTGIYGLNEKLIKKTNSRFGDASDRYKISLPIGEGNDKWGSFFTGAENITSVKYYGQDPGEVCNSVLLPLDKKIKVRFNSGEKEYDPKDLIKAYGKSRDDYRNFMAEQMHLENVSEERVSKRGDDNHGFYYIVKIPIQSGETISFIAPDYSVKEHEDAPGFYDINLGERGKERNVRIIAEDGSFTEKRIPNGDIKEKYDLCALAARIPVEEETEEDLDR